MNNRSAFSRHGTAVLAILLLVVGCYLMIRSPSATLRWLPGEVSPSTRDPGARDATAPSLAASGEDRTAAPDLSAGGERSALAPSPAKPGDACPVIVRVTHAGLLVGGAEVVWADAAAVERHRVALAAGAQRGPESPSLADRLRAIGAVASTGEQGEVQLIARGAPLMLHAVHRGLTATSQVAEITPGQRVELQLQGGDVLRLRLVDAVGQPVPEMSIVAVWQRADPRTGLGQRVLELGATDAEGRLVFRSWMATAQAANAALGAPGAATLVGPAVVGLSESGFVRVPEQAPTDELIVVVAPTRVIDCQLVTAAGDEFFLDGVQTTLWSAAGVLAESAAEASGRTRHRVASDAELAFRVHFVDIPYGAGMLARSGAGDGMQQLHCDAVCSVRGAVLGDAERCDVRYHSLRRGEVHRVLDLEDGRFWMALPMEEGVRSLAFAIDAQRITVEVPDVLPPTWELGVLRGSGEPFARLRLSANGESFVGEVGWRASGAGLPVGVAVVEFSGEEYLVHAPAGVQQLRIEGVAAGYAPFSMELVRGKVVDLALRPIVVAQVVVNVPSALDTSRLHVRLRQRWDEVAQAWQPEAAWRPVRRTGDGASAVFEGQPAGRYVAEVWSLAPPRALGSAELVLGGPDALWLDAGGARDVTFRVDAGPDGFWLAAGSTLMADVPIGVRHFASGQGVWTVDAQEREVLLMSPGRAPSRASIGGSDVQASLAPFDERSLGLGGGAARLEPLVAGRSPRPVHVFSLDEPAVSVEVLALTRWAESVVLPCDYAVLIDGQRTRASWEGQSWRLQAR